MATSIWNVTVTTVCGKRYVVPALVFAVFLMYLSYTTYGHNSVGERTAYPSPQKTCAISKDCQSNCSVCFHQRCHDVTEGVTCSPSNYVQTIQNYIQRKSGNSVVVSSVICLQDMTKIKCLVKENSQINTLINSLKQDIRDSYFQVCRGALWILKENSPLDNIKRQPKLLKDNFKVDFRDSELSLDEAGNGNRLNAMIDVNSDNDRGNPSNTNLRNQGANIEDNVNFYENTHKGNPKTNSNLRPFSVKGSDSLKNDEDEDKDLTEFLQNKDVRNQKASESNPDRNPYPDRNPDTVNSNTLNNKNQAASIPRTNPSSSDMVNTTRPKQIDQNVQNVFEEIAQKSSWGGGAETRSGPGSLLASTVSLRECLGRWIQKYNIRSIVDIPCGDANWQRSIPGIENVAYRGYDISFTAVSRARTKNSMKNMLFGVMDITRQIPPPADLIILRDFVQHLPLALGLHALNNARRSGAKWIGISSYPDSQSNRNINTGDYYRNNVQIAPFNMQNVTEMCDNYSGEENRGHPGSKFLLFQNKLSQSTVPRTEEASKVNPKRNPDTGSSNTLTNRNQEAPTLKSNPSVTDVVNSEGTKQINEDVQNVFEDIAQKSSWGGGSETRSGPGSLLASTVSLRECLGRWIQKYNIRSIVDIPCGDANWQRSIPGIENVAYRGYDISSTAVSRARSKNSMKNMLFGIMDISSKIPPEADLIILRDFVQHLPLALGLRALNNARRSGAKWIGISSYPDSRSNRNINTGDYYRNNVQIAPFNMQNVAEMCDNYSGEENRIHSGSKFLLFQNKLALTNT